ncbi:hypothetical protein ACLOJK_024796 [Asimina triloba]
MLGRAAAAGKQKAVGGGDANNRRALGDIGNLVDVRGAVAEGKPLPQISRPITRSFCAQLLANAQAAAEANNKKTAAVVIDAAIEAKAGRAKVTKQKALVRKEQEKVIQNSPETAEKTDKSENGSTSNDKSSRKNRAETLTTILSARSKVACGLLPSVADIDAADAGDQLAVVDYVEDIYKYYKLAQVDSMVPDYMDSQVELNEKMRAILIDWLVEVHNKFELTQETLYLTIQIIDRYLSMKTVRRKEFQLVGMTAMLIASKYEEIWAPEIELGCGDVWQVNDLICISDRAYNREQILRMEKSILNKLEWSLTLPTHYVFLVRFIKAAAAVSEKDAITTCEAAARDMEHLAFFLAELALMQYCMIMYSPSMVAAAAVYAANCTLKRRHGWTETLRHHTGYSEPQLMDCAKMLVKFHSLAGEGKLKVVYKKYSRPQRRGVALLPPAEKLL